MKELRHLLFVVAAAVFFIGLFILCDRFSKDVVSEYSSAIDSSLGLSSGNKQSQGVSINDVMVAQKIQRMVELDYSIDMKMTVMGGILCQRQQMIMAYDEEDKEFRFQNGLQYLKQIISSGEGELVLSVLGTTMAGSGKGYESDIYGYCATDGMYNSPEALARDLADMGITLLGTATNHAMDSGVEGVFSTIENLEKAKIAHVGTAKSKSEKKDYLFKHNYVNIAVTSYTNSTNGIEVPSTDPYAVNTLNGGDETKVKEMLSHIQELAGNNDYVITLMNFGQADSDEIDDGQKELAQKMAEAGADLIIGYGTRAVKPMDILTVTDKDGTQNRCIVFYGLGCIYSSDYYTEYENLDTDLSVVINLNLRNAISGKVSLTEMEVIPVYLNWYNDLVQPVPVCEAKDSDKYKAVLDEMDKVRLDDAYMGTVGHLLEGTKLKADYNKDTYSYTVKFY